MVVEKDLKFLLESDVLNYNEVIEFLTATNIFNNKDWYKLFLLIVNTGYRNGYLDAMKFAVDSEKKLNKGADVDGDSIGQSSKEVK